MSRRVAVVGSTSFQITTPIGAQIVDLIRHMGEDVVLLTRGTGEVEHFIATIAPLLDLRCFSYPSQGGADNWIRDVELVRDADEVIAIVSRADLEGKKETGTLHVIEKALDQGRATRLYTEVDGSLVGVATSD
jgi:hypothetical protein